MCTLYIHVESACGSFITFDRCAHITIVTVIIRMIMNNDFHNLTHNIRYAFVCTNNSHT